MKKRTKILGILALTLIVMQFFPIDKTNPPSKKGEDFIELTNPPTEVASLIKAACYDCHSHQTVYPWYSSIAPISFFLRSHIRGGRQHLNFSEWGTYSTKKANHKLEEMAEEIEEKTMPMKSYMWLHPEGKLSTDQRKSLVDWLKNQEQKVGKKEEETPESDLTKFGIIADDPANKLGGLKLGDLAPNFKAKDQNGYTVFLTEKLKTGPVVLVFYRGYWCGYCNQQLEELENELANLKTKGVSVIAVSPESNEYAKRMNEKTKTTIPVISDTNKSIMQNYKVAFQVTTAYQDKVKKYVKKDLNEMSGYSQATLPVPATYVIGTDQKIIYSFYNPDYSKRASTKEILEVL